MLDFRFISDEKSMHIRDLAHAGGIEYEEFEKAQDLKIIESHLDYYGKSRWSSQQVKQKLLSLTPLAAARVPELASILKQAVAADCGLVAFGD